MRYLERWHEEWRENPTEQTCHSARQWLEEGQIRAMHSVALRAAIAQKRMRVKVDSERRQRKECYCDNSE